MQRETKREWAKLDEHEQRDEIRHAAEEVDSAANAFGRETVDELVTAVQESPAALRAQLDDRWLSPSCSCRRGSGCDHGFPPHFCREIEASHGVKMLRKISRWLHG